MRKPDVISALEDEPMMEIGGVIDGLEVVLRAWANANLYLGGVNINKNSCNVLTRFHQLSSLKNTVMEQIYYEEIEPMTGSSEAIEIRWEQFCHIMNVIMLNAHFEGIHRYIGSLPPCFSSILKVKIHLYKVIFYYVRS